MPHHLRPSTAYAEDALLPGDPGRALALAQQLLTQPRMSNHARGLWGYTGETPGGRALSIQSTGMGGPSAAIVMQELAGLVESDPDLSSRLAAAEGTPTPARIVTTDLFYEIDDDSRATWSRAEAWRRRGAVAFEMEAATLFTIGERLGVATACLLAVSDTFDDGERRRIGDQALADAARRMGSIATAALEG